MSEADVAAIRNLRHPVEDAAVERARQSISNEQLRAWAEDVIFHTVGSLRTLDGKVPYLSPAHRVAILEAAIYLTKVTEAPAHV